MVCKCGCRKSRAEESVAVSVDLGSVGDPYVWIHVQYRSHGNGRGNLVIGGPMNRPSFVIILSSKTYGLRFIFTNI